MDSLALIETAKAAIGYFRQHTDPNEVWFVLAIAIFSILSLSALRSRYEESLWLNKLRRRNVLTPPEQKFYRVLKTTLPNKVIFAQVSFNALLTARGRSVRARFNRLYADFVICNPEDFSVVAIVELDDERHRTNDGRQKDNKRDKMLRKAGYKIARFDVSEKLFQEEILARIMSDQPSENQPQ